MKQPNYYEVIRLMASWNMLHRLQWVAQECQNLEEILYPHAGQGTTAGKAWGLVKLGMYQQALEVLADSGHGYNHSSDCAFWVSEKCNCITAQDAL